MQPFASFAWTRHIAVFLGVLLLSSVAVAQAPAPTPPPTSAAFDLPMTGAVDLEDAIEDAHQQNRSRWHGRLVDGPITLVFQGLWTPPLDSLAMALYSDDGSTLEITPVLDTDPESWRCGPTVVPVRRAGRLQGHHDFHEVFHPINYAFQRGQTYHLKLTYTNVGWFPGDFDGVTLFLFKTKPFLDVDMDVDHTTQIGYPIASKGDRGEVEESWEESAAVFTRANGDNYDDDGVVDWADGIDIYGNGQANSCRNFNPMIVESNVPFASWTEARIVFKYAASNPADIVRRVSDEDEGTFSYSLPNNNPIRIWKKDGPSIRNPLPAQQGGDFVQPDHPYTAQELGWTGEVPLTLYVEMVGPTGLAGPRPISVEIPAIAGKIPTLKDQIKIESFFSQSGNYR